MSATAPHDQNRCPRCGAPQDPARAEGLCPRCLVAMNLAPPTQAPTAEVQGGQATWIKPPTLAPPSLEEISSHFPHLEILECLGRGGMGVVYRARQPHLNRFVAVKILAPETQTDMAFGERFTREAQALARLSHQGIVAIHDFGKVNGLFYLLMEYVDGVSLRQLLQTKKLPPEEALAIVPKICEALEYAHAHGVVHRDIKPENVLVNKEGQVKIADFGIAKMVGAGSEQQALTRAEQVVGTPHYMAPEQVETPQRVDHRADIYSLGVVFYEMLTGELPLGKFAPPSRKVQVDVRLDEVVLRALEKEPERRYQHASEVKTAVETIASAMGPAAQSGGPGASEPGQRQAPVRYGPSGRYQFGLLPNLWPGERVLYFGKGIWASLWKSLPNYRFFLSLPPIGETGLYVTDHRIIVVTHALRLLTHECSMWLTPGGPNEIREVFQRAVCGRSRWLGNYLDLFSEYPEKHWYRSLELRLRLYTREPAALQQVIAAAPSQTGKSLPSGPSPVPAKAGGSKAVLIGAIAVVFALALMAGMLWPSSFQRNVAPNANLIAPAVFASETNLVFLVQPYPLSYAGAPTDKISLQYAVLEICHQAGFECDWDEAFQQVGLLRQRWIYPAITNQTFAVAMDHLLVPWGLTYEITASNSIILERQ